MNHSVETAFEKRPNLWLKRIPWIVTIAVITLISLRYVDYRGIASGGLPIVQSIFKSLFSPNWDALLSLSQGGVPYLILETIAIAFLGTFIGMILSIPLSFLSASNIVPRWLSALGVTLITIIRTFPPFVYGLMLIRVAGPGAFTGVLTLAITSVGMISKLFIEAIEDLDTGILEALDASGCTQLQKVRYGIVPQLLGNFSSIAIYRFEINVKNASILGLVGAGGIGAPIIFAMSGYRWSDVGALLWGLIILVIAVEFVSARIRRKLA